MTWFPIGPDFVNQPRVTNYTRLSKRNQWGGQGRINCISFERGTVPATPANIYVVVTDGSGQCAACRKGQDDKSWQTITDSERQRNPNLDPRWIAVNPRFPEWIYMGTWHDQGIYVSSSRGDAGSWNPKISIPGRVRKIIVDPTIDVDGTFLYAATDTGIYKSSDNGGSWTPVLSGDVWSFSFRRHPSDGSVHAYAGVFRSGIWYANAAPVDAGSWTNLSEEDIGLPAFNPGDDAVPANFDTILLDSCASNPAAAYAWVTAPNGPGVRSDSSHTIAVYKTTSPTTAWTAAASPPVGAWSGGVDPLNPYQGYTNYCFAVSPNSPGNGTDDILFFGSFGYVRSIDSGTNWWFPETGFHADQHTFGFYPESYRPGDVPSVYIGCDGGLGRNTRLADPAVAFDAAFPDTHTNAGPDFFPTSGIFINENDGLQNSLVYVLSCDPGGVVPPYIGCVDTGLAVKQGGLGWRGFGPGDSFQLAVARGVDGVKVWQKFHAGYAKRMSVAIDSGELSLSGTAMVALDSEANSQIEPTSNFVLDTGARCLTGATTEETVTTTTADVTAGTDVTIPVVSTAEILDSPYVAIGQLPNRQAATAENLTPTSFTVRQLFADAPAGTVIRPIRPAVCRVDQAGVATRISQFLGRIGQSAEVVAANPAATPRMLACAVNYSRQLYRIDGALTDPGRPTWQEITTGRPLGVSISSMVVANNGDLYVLLLDAVSVTVDGTDINTPFFRISAMGDSWQPLECVDLPGDVLPDGSPYPYGKLVLDPVTSDRFFASYGGKVYTIAPGTAPRTWAWSTTAAGLPGALVSDLWAGRFDDPAGGTPKVLLRAGVVGRGVWEADVTPSATETAVSLYVRRHHLDTGWFTRALDSFRDPFHPDRWVFHYHCADIKIETPSIDAGGNTYFQTDPEGSGVTTSTATTPAPDISNVAFDLIRDGSDELPAGDKVRLHVQVHNRSNLPVNDVSVWVLFANAAGGLPALNTTDTPGVTFPFWDQFHADGTIHAALPVNSIWKQVGTAPVILQGIDVNHPKVASWIWDVPSLAPADSGHYCIGAFIHCGASLIGESTRVSIDEISPDNRQVGQKNVHIVTIGGPRTRRAIRVEFHNASEREREIALVVDCTSFPKEFSQSVRLTSLKTTKPLGDSVSGLAGIRQPWVWEVLGFRILTFLVNLLWRFGLIKRRLLLQPQEFMLKPASSFEITGVHLQAGEFVIARVSVTAPGPVQTGEEYRMEVQHREGRKLVGGSTFVFMAPPTDKLIISQRISEREFAELENKGHQDENRYLPPYVGRMRGAAISPTSWR